MPISINQLTSCQLQPVKYGYGTDWIDSVQKYMCWPAYWSLCCGGWVARHHAGIGAGLETSYTLNLTQFCSVVDFQAIAEAFYQSNSRWIMTRMHLKFSDNPGVGETTAASPFGKTWQNLNVSMKENMSTSTGTFDTCAIEKAQRGVIFIEETDRR